MNHYHLQISCPDQPGIIAKITAFLADQNANILDLKQHSATDIDTFFQRTHFATKGLIDEIRFTQLFQPIASSLNLEWTLHSLARKHRLGIFVSKTSHCLYELLLKNQDGKLDCDIPCIISNHMDLEIVARQFDIPFYFVDSKQPKPLQENQFNDILQRHMVDTIVMARYMQILRKEFTELWRHRIINIHHGFLPAFQGAKPYHQAWTKGVKMIGATAHYATEDLDQGPIISQDVVRIHDGASIDEFVDMGKDVERRVLLDAVNLHLNHSIFVRNGRTFILHP